MIDYSKLLTSRIRFLCAQRTISIHQFSKMGGGKSSTINDILNGKTKNPSIKTIHEIASGFGLTVAEFLDFKEFNEAIIKNIK